MNGHMVRYVWHHTVQYRSPSLVLRKESTDGTPSLHVHCNISSVAFVCCQKWDEEAEAESKFGVYGASNLLSVISSLLCSVVMEGTWTCHVLMFTQFTCKLRRLFSLLCAPFHCQQWAAT
jgi:hypothetical protein